MGASAILDQVVRINLAHCCVPGSCTRMEGAQGRYHKRGQARQQPQVHVLYT